MTRAPLYGLFGLLTLAACATTPPATSGPPAAQPAPTAPAANTSDARDCAVFATVLREQHHVDASTPFRLQRGSAARNDTYFITCDFAAMGIPVKDYDYAHVDGPGRENFQPWLTLGKPDYPTPDSAIVATGSLIGPLAGSGVRCFLKKAGAGWTLMRCEQAWVS